MGIFNEFNKKEKPFFTGIARGLVVLVLVLAGGGASGTGGFLLVTRCIWWNN